MNLRQFSRPLRAASAALVLLLAVGASAQTVDDKPEVKTEVVQRMTDIITKRAYVPGVDFSQWTKFLEEVQPKVDAAKSDPEFQSALNLALSKFGFSHIVLTTPQQAELRRTGSTVGVGITTMPTEKLDGLVVVRTVKDAPAEKAGIVPGDTITAVDGNKVEGIKGIPGKEGTDVKLTIKHDDGKVEDYIVTRKPFSTVRPEELTWPDKDTAKLTIYTFDFTYDRSNVEKLMTDASKAKNLIIDLRDNGGGAVINLEHLLGMLIPDDKPIGTFVSRKLVADYVEDTKGDPKDLAAMAQWSKDKVKPRGNIRVPVYKGNLVVLVNGGSGSASEIAAAALKDEANATIVGTKSAGAVLVSVIVPVSNGFMLQYPLSDYITVKGVRLEGNGVTPDVVAQEQRYRLPSSKDEALAKALGVFAQANKGS